MSTKNIPLDNQIVEVNRRLRNRLFTPERILGAVSITSLKKDDPRGNTEAVVIFDTLTINSPVSLSKEQRYKYMSVFYNRFDLNDVPPVYGIVKELGETFYRADVTSLTAFNAAFGTKITPQEVIVTSETHGNGTLTTFTANKATVVAQLAITGTVQFFGFHPQEA